MPGANELIGFSEGVSVVYTPAYHFHWIEWTILCAVIGLCTFLIISFRKRRRNKSNIQPSTDVSVTKGEEINE